MRGENICLFISFYIFRYNLNLIVRSFLFPLDVDNGIKFNEKVLPSRESSTISAIAVLFNRQTPRKSRDDINEFSLLIARRKTKHSKVNYPINTSPRE